MSFAQEDTDLHTGEGVIKVSRLIGLEILILIYQIKDAMQIKIIMKVGCLCSSPGKEISLRKNKNSFQTSEAMRTAWEHKKFEIPTFIKIRILLEESYFTGDQSIGLAI